MKEIAAVLVLMVVAAFPGWSFAKTGDPATDLLIEKLVQKGVLSSEEAKALENDLKKAKETGNTEQAEAEKEESKTLLPFELRVRVQTRFDIGDLLVRSDGRYKTENDLFLRRVRLEVEKNFINPPVGKELKLEIVLDADRFDQDFRRGQRINPRNRVNLHYMYGDWIFFDEFALEIGKHKLPFLRAELTSSSRQLFIERPASNGVANDTFGDYHQPQVMAHGMLLDGTARYYTSYADGANNLDDIQTLDSSATAVQKQGWGNAFIGRIELSPLAFVGKGDIEKKRDDTGIGKENHLTLAIDGGVQEGIKYATSTVTDAKVDTRLISVDLAGRYHFDTLGTVTGQAEYLTFKKAFNYKEQERPKAYYWQVGYLLPWAILRGSLEPAVRYELFDHDRIDNKKASGTKERTWTGGLNYYLLKHSIKLSYNYAYTDFDAGVAETVNQTARNLHEILLQLYF